MQNLNPDCLYQIFVKLDLREQLILTRVCKLFQEIIYDWILRPQFHSLDNEDPRLVTLQNYEISILYQLILYNVKRVRFIEPNKKIANLLINKLDFLLSHDLCNLEEFEGCDQQITNEEIAVLENNCRNLRKLTIRSYKVTGNYIGNMPELRQLTLTACSISPDFMKRILANTSITYLKLIKNRVPLEPTLLNTHSVSLTELIVDDAVAFGLLLADTLRLRSFQYDTRGVNWADLCPEQITQVRRKTQFQSLKENLQFIGLGKTKNALHILIELLVPQKDEYTRLTGMGVLLLILRLVNSCKHLNSIELETSIIDNFNALKLLLTELERQQRVLNIAISYTKKSDRLNQQKEWLSESVAYKNQNRLTVDFNLLPKAKADDIHLIKYGFK